MLGFLFGKKVVCFQCDKKVKEKQAFYRRGFHVCSQACLESFLAENQLRPPPDLPPEKYPEHAKLEMELALSEITGVVRVSGGSVGYAAGLIGGSIAVSAAIQSLEDAKDGVARYNDHVLRALPLLQAMGMKAEADFLETVNLDVVYEMSAIGAGRVQQNRIRKIAEPVGQRVAMIVQELQSRV